jgi:hypothetical protein
MCIMLAGFGQEVQRDSTFVPLGQNGSSAMDVMSSLEKGVSPTSLNALSAHMRSVANAN